MKERQIQPEIQDDSENRHRRWVLSLLAVSVILISGCTATRWSVDDPRYLDRQSDDEKVEESYRVGLAHDVTRESPYLTFQLYRLDRFSVTERVRMQRRLQSYTPTWGFAAIASLGAAISFYAGSRSGLTGLTTHQQSLAFNAMGVLLSLAVVAHLAPEGDAIETEEYLSLRGRSGQAVVTDTVRVVEDSPERYPVRVQLTHAGDVMYDEEVDASETGRWVLDLPDLFRSRIVRGTDPGVVQMRMVQEADTLSQAIPVERFLQPVIQVQQRTSQLYRSMEGEEFLTTVAEGSEFPLVGEFDRPRYSVQFGGSLVYIDRDESEIYWRRADRVMEPSVLPAGEVPFGEIGVEFGLPALVDSSRGDMAILVSNHRGNLLGSRRFTDRDLEMVSLYMEESFAVEPSALYRVDMAESSPAELPEAATGDRVILWVSGFARVIEGDGGAEVNLVSMQESGEERSVPVSDILREAARRSGDSMIAFLDLTYLDPEELTISGDDVSFLEQVSDSVAAIQPESALLFASRPGQVSGRYESLRFENRFHHIFPYYVAQAWKQGITRLDELTAYVRRQVDYTSRRLHDRPQNVLFFGRADLDMGGE